MINDPLLQAILMAPLIAIGAIGGAFLVALLDRSKGSRQN